jgi:hypothetical protein
MFMNSKSVSALLISGIFSILFLAACNDNGDGGGGEPFPPPNSLIVPYGITGGTAPDGGEFRSFDRWTGPSNSGWVGFRTVERYSEDTLRAVLYRGSFGELFLTAATGDPAPGGGTFKNFPETIGVNDSGQLAFIGNTGVVPDDPFGDTDGYYIASDDGAIDVIVREGDPAPGGGAISKLCMPGFLGCFYNHGGLNGGGQIAFTAVISGAGSDRGLFLGDASGLTEIARKGGPVPGGNGVFNEFYYINGPNDSGWVAFVASLSGTSGGDSDNEGVYLYTGAGIIELAREGEDAPGGDGFYADFDFIFGINGSGQTTLTAILGGTSGGENDNYALYIAGESGVTELARTGDPAPETGGGIIDGIYIPTNPNENGEVAFDASIQGGDGDQSINTIIYLAGPSGLTKLIRSGDAGPGCVGRFAGFLLSGQLNDHGQVIFRAGLVNGRTAVAGLYRVGPNSSVTTLAQVFQPATPDGQKNFRSIGDRFLGHNNSGAAFFTAGLMNADRTYSRSDFGIFLAQ